MQFNARNNTKMYFVVSSCFAFSDFKCIKVKIRQMKGENTTHKMCLPSAFYLLYICFLTVKIQICENTTKSSCFVLFLYCYISPFSLCYIFTLLGFIALFHYCICAFRFYMHIGITYMPIQYWLIIKMITSNSILFQYA